ncbi:MAG TPA: diguanylate cyclase [Armatimonadota bacterium]|nr:diguanylate cyclase [Armatimonadota bacterium]
MANLLENELARYRSLLFHAPIGCYQCRLSDGQLIACNDRATRLFGYDRREDFLASGPFTSHYVQTEVLQRVTKQLESSGEVADVEVQFYRRDGSVFLACCTFSLHGDDTLFVLINDDADVERVTAALHRSDQRYRELVDMLPQIVFELDLTGRVIFGNRRCYEKFGYTELDYARGINAFNSIIPEDRNRMRENMQRIIAGEPTKFSEYTVLRTDGSTFPALMYSSPIYQDGVPIGIRGIIVDITERKQTEKRLNELAYFDPLTHLPNRVQFRERLENAIAQAHKTGEHVSIMLLDLDGFKEINDTLGHDVGDSLLILVARRLSACIRSSDLVCRQGGDEFIVILSSDDDQLSVESMAKRLIAAFHEPFSLGPSAFRISASIGISTFPVDGDDPKVLFKHADVAMYAAKAQGKGAYMFFSPKLHQQHELTDSVLG